MKIINVQGIGSSSYTAIDNLCSSSLKTLLESYDNITFVERYEATSTIMYYYEIAGFENIYLMLEAQSSALALKVQLKSAIHTSSVIFTILSTGITSSSGGATLASTNIYIVSENNNLKAVTLPSTPTSMPNGMSVFSDDSYVIYSGSAYYDDAVATRYYINTQYPAYAEMEKALKRNAIISTSASSGSFIARLSDVYQLINSQFNANGIILIAIGNNKYRQIDHYIFVANGEE